MSEHPVGPVVAGIDGTDESMCAADYGAWEAATRGVPLRLVYARRPSPLWGPSTAVVDEYAWQQDWIRSLLTRTTAELTDAHPEVAIEAAALSGGPAGILVAESATASVIVIGTRASGGLRGHLSASVAVQVAAHASCPVVAIRGIAGRRCDMDAFAGKPVVVGFDGSGSAGRALAYAAEQAAVRRTELRAVLAWTMPESVLEHATGSVEDRLGQEQLRADGMLDEALREWAGRYPDVPITRRAVYDIDPARVLIDQSREAGLVVVGSRGGGGFLGLRLGSTVDGLIRGAHAPVAVVRGDTGD